MPVEVQKEVTTTSSTPVANQTTQTAQVSQVPTNAEVQDRQVNRGNAWIWYLVGIVDVLLLLRLIFHLFGAKSTGFASFLYGLTGPLEAPFRGIFAAPTVDGSYFDTAAIVAIVVYMLVGWGISKLIDLAMRPSSSKQV